MSYVPYLLFIYFICVLLVATGDEKIHKDVINYIYMHTHIHTHIHTHTHTHWTEVSYEWTIHLQDKQGVFSHVYFHLREHWRLFDRLHTGHSAML